MPVKGGSMRADRLSRQDASFLHIEDHVSHMHIASVAIFEGPPPPFSDVVAMVDGKLDLVPRYRQKVRFVPFELGRPVWVDDPHFNIEYHLRHTALPAPGGETELRKLVGRVMAQQLDRTKPLWEIWVVEGLEDDRWAILAKTHHALASRSAAATPSTSACCALARMAQRSSSSPSTTQISQRGFVRSSCWAMTRPTSLRSSVSPPGAGSAVWRRWYSMLKCGSSTQTGRPSSNGTKRTFWRYRGTRSNLVSTMA